MPAGDGTGPMGMGSMTGRAAGFCAGFGMPGYANPISGRGFGMGFGRGHGGRGGRSGGYGRRNMFHATGLPGWMRAGVPFAAPYATVPTKEQEMEMLKSQAEQMGETLAGINKRIQELDSESSKR